MACILILLIMDSCYNYLKLITAQTSEEYITEIKIMNLAELRTTLPSF